jgi:hypothetical protein
MDSAVPYHTYIFLKTNVRFGSLAVITANTSLMSAFGRKADVQVARNPGF